MKIRILKSCSGINFSYTQDEIVDVDERIGKDLVGCKFAEKISSAKPTVRKEQKAETDDNA